MEGVGLELEMEDYDLTIERMEGGGVVFRGEKKKRGRVGTGTGDDPCWCMRA